jgi:hypothetical protein
MLCAISRSTLNVNLVGVLILHIGGHVQRPDESNWRDSSLSGVSPATFLAAARVSAVSILPSPFVSTSLHGPDFEHLRNQRRFWRVWTESS